MANPLNRIRYPDLNIRIYVNPVQERKARALVNRMPEVLKRSYREGCTVFGNRVLKLIKEAMTKHMPVKGSGDNWPPLSKNTLKRWGEHGIYTLTNQYLNSIALRISGNGYKVYVGMPEKVMKRSKGGRNNGLTLTEVAQILEYGTRDGSIPPRPLWRPAYKVAGGTAQLRKDVVRNIQKGVRKYL